MGLVAWGILLIVVGLLLTFSSLIGFLPGLPLIAIGIGLAVVGALLWLISLPMRVGRHLAD